MKSRQHLENRGGVSFNKKAAFTLAEVLITLGIIGVVAAMTIPGLMAKYKQRMFVHQWRKTYAELAQALRLMQLNEDVVDGTEYSYASTLGQYLKHGKICSEGKFIEEGCTPKDYQMYDLSGAKFYASNLGDIGGGATCMTLLNGALVCFDAFIAYVDINNISSPNTIGKDIYAALIDFDNYSIRPAIGGLTGWGAADGVKVLNDYGDRTCKPTNNDYGYGCSYFYMHNMP